MTQQPVGYAWPPLPVTDLELAAQILAERLGAAWDDLEAERLAVITATGIGRRDVVTQVLSEFQASIAGFAARIGGEAAAFLEQHIGPRYAQAVEAATGQPMSWNSVHVAALTSLATDTFGDFLQRAEQAQQVGERFARAVRQVSASELTKAAAGGRTVLKVADRIEERLLTEYGITTVTYRDGSRVPVRAWARMAARTKSAVAYNAGTLNGCMEQGVGYVEVMDGVECGWKSHDDEDKANGSVRSAIEAARYAISHPNCTRGFGPRPDVTSDEEAAKAETMQDPAQLADQQAQAQAKTAALAPRTRAAAIRRAQQQVKRQQRQLGAQSTGDVATLVKGILGSSGIA